MDKEVKERAKRDGLLCDGHQIKRNEQAAKVKCVDCEIERLQTKVDTYEMLAELPHDEIAEAELPNEELGRGCFPASVDVYAATKNFHKVSVSQCAGCGTASTGPFCSLECQENVADLGEA